MSRDRIEFYVGSVRNGGIAQIDSSHAPEVGETVVIKGVSYTVEFRSWALDYSGTANASMCCNVILATTPQTEGRERWAFVKQSALSLAWTKRGLGRFPDD